MRMLKYFQLSQIRIAAALLLSLVAGCSTKDDAVKDPFAPKAVTKTNTMQMYMHYMPWFQSKPVSGYWGSHWRMANRNPDIIDSNGQREIASHYYPLIGPYDSNDKDVIEYHLLLMKYAGIDAVLIDWYGSHNINDYGTNLIATNSLISKLSEVGLKFSVVYEEYTAESVQNQTGETAIHAAQADLAYAQNNYFKNPQHLAIDNQPVLLTFGPRYFTQESQWAEIFSKLSTKPKFLPLWWHSGLTGATSNGEFAWIDFNADFSDLTKFYNGTTALKIGAAFPRFHDYYAEGGWGTSYGYVDSNNGQTMINTLAKAKSFNLKYLQLDTWNDFGEGTVIEPTVEDQFNFLESIQQFTGVTYGHDELALIYQYYLKKQQYKADSTKKQTLLEIYHHLTALEVFQARDLLTQLP